MADASLLARAEKFKDCLKEVLEASELAQNGREEAIQSALEAFEKLKAEKVDTQLLVATQGGKKVRKLTKHQDLTIGTTASELVNVWKEIVAEEAALVEKSKAELGGLQPLDAIAAPVSSRQNAEDSIPPSKRQRVEESGRRSDASTATAQDFPAKPICIPKSGDPARDKIRSQLAEALQLACDEVPQGDPGGRAADIEKAVLAQTGAVNPRYKAKIRSIWVNLKDLKNPDFRRAVLTAEISGEETVNLKPEEMASKARQEENQRIREAAMFEAERGKKRLATTDQFQCGRCKCRQTSYYQMQTRSADEPMTTFVICANCDNRWKFC